MKSIHRLLQFIVLTTILTGCSSKVSTIKRDLDLKLDASEGYLMFTVDTSVDLERILIDGEKKIALTPKDLKAGSNTILLTMPAGDYQFDSIDYRHIFQSYYVKLEPQMWHFKVEPYKINYVGHVKFEKKFLREQVRFYLVNKSSEAQEYLEQNFSNILENRKVVYHGPGSDQFFDFISSVPIDKQRPADSTEPNLCSLPHCNSIQQKPDEAARFLNPDTLFRIEETQMVKLSPDGKHIMGIHVKGGVEQLILTNTEDVTRSDVLKFGDDEVKLQSFQWIDNDTLYLEYTKRKFELVGLIELVWSENSFKPKLMTFKNQGYVLDPMEAVDNQLIYARHEEEGDVLYILTPKQLREHDFDEANRMPNQMEDALFYFANNAKRELIAVTRDDDDIQIWYRGYDDTRWLSLGNVGDSKHDFKPIGVVDENTLAVLSDEETNQMALVEYDIKAKRYGKVLFKHDRYDLVGAAMASDGKTIDYVRYFDHGRLITQYFLEDDRSVEAAVQQQLSGKQFVVTDEKSGSGNKLLFVFEPGDPGAFYLYNKNQAKLSLIGETLPDLDNTDYVKPEVISVQVEGDTEVEAILSKPGKNANGVLLVMPHGGPVGVQVTAEFNRAIRYLNDRGYAILEVNFRGSSGYGKAFEAQGVGQFGQAIEDDISKVVKKVKQQYAFDHMCSIGASYGGYSALMLAIRSPQDYQCVIAMYGVYDLPLIFNSSNVDLLAEQKQSIENVLGKNNPALYDVSPFYLADKITMPLLLIAGEKDQIAWFEQSNRLKYRLQQLGTPFEHIFYHHVGHGHHLFITEHHQYAYIDDFIRRQFALPLPFSTNTRRIMREEYILLADTFDGRKAVDKDPDKAFYFYSKAAELGDPRAMFNIGSYYHRGLGVDKNLVTAMKWYQKSSDAGYNSGTFRLGQMYLDGIAIQPDAVKAMEMFRLAAEQGYQLAHLEIAKGLCLGRGVETDIEACIDMLKNARSRWSISEKQRKTAISDLFWSEQLTPQARDSLKQLLGSLYKVTGFDVVTGIDDWGVFVRQKNKNPGIVYLYGNVAHYKPHKSQPEVPLDKDNVAFGVRLNFNQQQNGDVALKVRWTTPEVKERKVIGTEQQESIYYLAGDDKYLQILYIINQEWEKVEASWKLEVFTLDNKLVYEQTFNTVK